MPGAIGWLVTKTRFVRGKRRNISMNSIRSSEWV